jgi:hypothetical protein
LLQIQKEGKTAVVSITIGFDKASGFLGANSSPTVEKTKKGCTRGKYVLRSA